MLSILKNNREYIYSILVGLFFILILHFKASYTAIPAILGLSGLYFVVLSIKNKTFAICPENRILVITFWIYFLLFVISLIVNKGEARELDLPSRVLIALPILTLLSQIKIKPFWVLYSILVACILAGIVAIIQKFYLHLPNPFPIHNRIQAGDIVMTLAVFSLCIGFYAYQVRNKLLMIIASIAFSFGFIASVLCLARGALVGFVIALVAILFFYRHLLSKKAVIFVMIFTLFAGSVSYKVAEKRWNRVSVEITQCLQKNKCVSSVGLRLDMYKSAFLGIQEKPIFGWGLEGVKEMRKQHIKQKYVSKHIARFNHSHNQFLHDGSARGLLGLLVLCAIFFVPFGLFAKGIKQTTNKVSQLFGVMGVVHILAIMGYCLTQGFLSHHSGNLFYLATVMILLSLQRITTERNK
ncbi:MAG: O-antigen ligase family protein [Pasteurella sp.]|nr:O-antigen ligase family protein [Pasteurella sp.]